MRAKGIVVAAVAAGVAATIVAALYPVTLAARDDAAREIPQPKLAVDGLEVTLSFPEGVKYQPGDKPVLELKAVNATQEKRTATILLSMTATEQPSKMERMMPSPVQVWQERQIVSVEAGATAVVPVSTGYAIPPGQRVDVYMQPAPPPAESADGAATKPSAASARPIRALTIPASDTPTTRPAAVANLIQLSRTGGR